MTASQYPQVVVEAAKRVLDNPDVSLLLSTRKEELEQDVLLSDEDKDILEAHNEHKHLVGLSEWISHVAGHKT